MQCSRSAFMKTSIRFYFRMQMCFSSMLKTYDIEISLSFSVDFSRTRVVFGIHFDDDGCLIDCIPIKIPRVCVCVSKYAGREKENRVRTWHPYHKQKYFSRFAESVSVIILQRQFEIVWLRMAPFLIGFFFLFHNSLFCRYLHEWRNSFDVNPGWLRTRNSHFIRVNLSKRSIPTKIKSNKSQFDCKAQGTCYVLLHIIHSYNAAPSTDSLASICS